MVNYKKKINLIKNLQLFKEEKYPYFKKYSSKFVERGNKARVVLMGSSPKII